MDNQETNIISLASQVRDYAAKQGGVWALVGFLVSLLLLYFTSQNDKLKKQIAALKLESAQKQEDIAKALFESKLSEFDAKFRVMKQESLELSNRISELEVEYNLKVKALENFNDPKVIHDYFDK